MSYGALSDKLSRNSCISPEKSGKVYKNMRNYYFVIPGLKLFKVFGTAFPTCEFFFVFLGQSVE